MTTAAVIVTYNSAAHVGECLRPLVDAGVEIHVVDNASTDETASLVRRLAPHAHVVANESNVGFAAAVNQAAERTAADVIVLVNPDCVVPTRTIRGLADYLAAHPGVGAVGPRLRDAAGRTAVSAHPFESARTVIASRFGGSVVPLGIRRLVAPRERRRNYSACVEGEAALDVDWISGACLAVRASALRAVGGLDEGYFMYYEDEELCLQLWRAGARVVYLPTVEAQHVGGASSSDPAHVWPHLYRSLLRFQARHRPHTYGIVRSAILLRALLGVGIGMVHDFVAAARAERGRRARAWLRVAAIAATEARGLAREARA